MEQFLEKVMNFINENTMLLIIICIFLIVILVIYLIDNTIKTKKLEREEALKKANPEEPSVVDNPIPEKVEEPVIEPSVTIETQTEEKIEPVVEEVSTTIVEVSETIEEPIKEETTTAPIADINIDDLLNKDYSDNNKVVESIPDEPVVQESIPVVPVQEEPVVEAPKSKYTNDKKLSDIFGKKEEPTKKIESTQDFSDELDRILQKLNSEESSKEDESTDYTNMF